MKRVFNEDQQQMEALNVNLYFKWKTVDWFGGFSETNWMENEVGEKTKQKKFLSYPKDS